MPADMTSIGIKKETYGELVKIQDRFKKKHNGNKSFDQIIQDLLKTARESA